MTHVSDSGGGAEDTSNNNAKRIPPCPSPQPSYSISSMNDADSSSNDGNGNFTPDKSKICGETPHISRTSLSVPSVSTSTTAAQSDILQTESTASTSPQQSRHQFSPTLKVLDALVKFQSCLFILSNTVGDLHESLKLTMPGIFSVGSSSSIMSSAIPRPFSKKSLTQPDVSLENNNDIKLPVSPSATKTQHEETVLSIPNSNSSASASLETVTTDASGFTSVNGNCHHAPHGTITKQRKQQFLGVTSGIQKFFKKYIGLFLALFASVCMSLVTLVVKFMEGYHPVSKVIWRLQGVLLPSLAIVLYVKYYEKKPLIVWKNSPFDCKGNSWKWKISVFLVARGLVGCSADIFQYYSLRYLPLADSTVISFSTPIFVCIVAHFMLGEQWGIVPILSALITLVGVVVISKPPILTGEEEMNNTVLWGNILAILCMICGTFTTIVMRYLKHVHFAMTMLALGIVGTVEGFLLTVFTSPFEFPQVISYHDLTLSALMAGLFFFGQLAQTLALKHEEAGVVSLVRTCDVLFAFVWQVNLLHQEATIFSYVGAAIVTLGVCITALRRWVSDMPDHRPLKKRLSFILR